MTAKHWQNVTSADGWPSIYFSPQEVACKGSGLVLLNGQVFAALRKLDKLRLAMGHPLILTSGYRSPAHNKAVGGAKASYHMRGVAFDVRMDNVDPHRFEAEARKAGFTGIGIYARSGFIHIDTRADLGAAPWRAVQQGAEFPPRAETRFAPKADWAPTPAAKPATGLWAALVAAVAAFFGRAR
jgi:zinc D-Ala-D-Ala carboxypeptidase